MSRSVTKGTRARVALLGGLLADAYSLTSVLLAGAALALAACPVAALSGRNDQP
ncbi:hypothetical protein ACPB9E_06990 [Streptomyces exfoliatus]|uniref:hypothetical protein n=1 Tax=Streptomyces exfoliatus TaxID=1905 RepID=UPI003C2CE3B1